MESCTVFVYRWGETLVWNCGTTAEQCRHKFKIDLFSLQLVNEIVAGCVIRKHHKTVDHPCRIAKKEEK